MLRSGSVAGVEVGKEGQSKELGGTLTEDSWAAQCEHAWCPLLGQPGAVAEARRLASC